MKNYICRMSRFSVLNAFVLFAVLFVAGCGSLDSEGTEINGVIFGDDSAILTNRYFPGKAGDVIRFNGYGAFGGSTYEWTLSEGEVIYGVNTLREEGKVTNPDGSGYTVFNSIIAQDMDGNVHVLKNFDGDEGSLSGVATGKTPTYLMPANPKVGDRFGPSSTNTWLVVSVDEIVDDYSGVLNIESTAQVSDGQTESYQDYWAPGVGQVKSIWTEADGDVGYWLRVE